LVYAGQQARKALISITVLSEMSDLVRRNSGRCCCDCKDRHPLGMKSRLTIARQNIRPRGPRSARFAAFEVHQNVSAKCATLVTSRMSRGSPSATTIPPHLRGLLIRVRSKRDSADTGDPPLAADTY